MIMLINHPTHLANESSPCIFAASPNLIRKAGIEIYLNNLAYSLTNTT